MTLPSTREAGTCVVGSARFSCSPAPQGGRRGVWIRGPPHWCSVPARDAAQLPCSWGFGIFLSSPLSSQSSRKALVVLALKTAPAWDPSCPALITSPPLSALRGPAHPVLAPLPMGAQRPPAPWGLSCPSLSMEGRKSSAALAGSTHALADGCGPDGGHTPPVTCGPDAEQAVL